MGSKMNEFWIVSDCHFRHNQPFLYEPRGFTSIDEHDETLVENWNKVVKKNDWVINLGDLCLSDIEGAIPYIQRLNGHQIWIAGNHDSLNKISKVLAACPNIQMLSTPDTSYATMITYGKIQLYLSHYPTLTANWDDKYFNQHVFSIHGHTHQKTNWLQPRNPFLYHVGMDSHNCTPVHIEEVISDIRNRWNEIGQLPTPAKPEDLYPYENI